MRNTKKKMVIIVKKEMEISLTAAWSMTVTHEALMNTKKKSK